MARPSLWISKRRFGHEEMKKIERDENAEKFNGSSLLGFIHLQSSIEVETKVNRFL